MMVVSLCDNLNFVIYYLIRSRNEFPPFYFFKVMLFSHVPFQSFCLNVFDLIKCNHSTSLFLHIFRRNYHMMDILSKVTHYVCLTQQNYLHFGIFSGYFLGVRHCSQSMIHSASKCSKAKNMFPTFRNCPFYSFLKVIFILVLYLFDNNTVTLIKLSNTRLQTVHISNDTSNLPMLTQACLIKNVSTAISQDNIISMPQCFGQPRQIYYYVVLDDNTIYSSTFIINF